MFEKNFLVFVLYFSLDGELNAMPGENCVLKADYSSDVPTLILMLKDLEKYVIKKHMLPWMVKLKNEGSTMFEYRDESHSIQKFTVDINANLEFTVYVCNWPIPDDHSIYQRRKRCLKTLNDATEMLRLVTNSNLCAGLPQDIDAIQTVAVDPTWNEQLSHYTKSTVIRHSVPKSICNTHFQSDVSFRSPNCEVILENISKEQCKPCSVTTSTLRKAETRKRKVSSVPAKSKASLAACDPEKLVATVKASCLQNKQLEDNIKLLEDRIKKDGVGVSEGLENDILKIMGGQNLEGTPHMKFFWEQQMKLLHAKKVGRYHPQIIQFALSLHGKSAATYRVRREWSFGFAW